MSNKGTEIVLTGDEVSTIVFALMKASAYENEYWRELAERSAKAENAMDNTLLLQIIPCITCGSTQN